MDSKHPTLLKDIFNPKQQLGTIKVPSYQRAYAWEEKQLKAFIADLLEITGPEGRQYYYGHFVLEQTNNGYTNVIDGQQRLTTFILFLLVCRTLGTENLEPYIDRFETVDYDTAHFDILKQPIRNNPDWDVKLLEAQLDDNTATLSIKRILFALDYFRKAFESKQGPSLLKADIDKYIDALLNASISCHLTDSKAVAVQIFELHNSRGIQLTTLEKVKSKLMKAAYVCDASGEESEAAVAKIQAHFAEIYRLEETLSAAVYRGNLSLEALLLHHLRMVDDGSKIAPSNNAFSEPSRYGNREEIILSYIGKCLAQGDALKYATGLANRFEQSVRFISEELPKLDKDNRLLGDVMILDRGLSTEFLLLLHFKGFEASLKKQDVLRLWEVLLFTRDFHGKYYNLKGIRDNFEGLFQQIATGPEEALVKTLAVCVEKGFRNAKMDAHSLTTTVRNYLTMQKEAILNRAFTRFLYKAKYILYKYELQNGVNLEELRAVVKKGISVEHILPQSWEWKWIGEDANDSEKRDIFKKKVESFINGIGNLIILTSSENSSVSNSHPKDKVYPISRGGSYQQHNDTRQEWENPENWASRIQERGELIYAFMERFIKPPMVALS